ncbi:GTPase [Streptomyces sp. TR06-5]|uniref:GTPase n=1 Tax=Streptomyces sp. TR06-5 TaxID=3385976 RepID=UPI0039A3B0C3
MTDGSAPDGAGGRTAGPEPRSAGPGEAADAASWPYDRRSAAEPAWPAADGGRDPAPAQVFRPEAAPAADEPETGTAMAPPTNRMPSEAGTPSVPPLPEGPPEPPVHGEPAPPPDPAGHRWDDGLIARRAPRSPAGPAEGAQAPPASGDASPGAGEAGTPAPLPRTPRPDRTGASPQTADPQRSGAPEPSGTARARSVDADDRPAPPTAPRPRAQRPPGAGGLPAPDGLGAGPVGGPLRHRLAALRELIGLSRTRLDGKVLAEAGRVLDEAGARAQLSAAYTTVALAGATGSGKSSLFNALAGRELSETGLRRPTTSQPVACTWEAEREGGADGLLDRLGVAPTMRRRVRDAALHGLVLIDLPDHDSVAPDHRAYVDRLLGLVDAVVWVVDPEKYADAALHERYLRPFAGYAEVSFVVLNQVDRLSGDAAEAVLHDLRRLLDEDGMALGDHGEPGARVLATSALTGDGMTELRQELGAFTASQQAPALRLTADLDGAAERLRRVYADPELPAPVGLTDADREEFEDLLATAVGACAAGQAAERAWLRHAERSCGTPWSQLVRRNDERRSRTAAAPGASSSAGAAEPGAEPGGAAASEVRVARPVVAHAVRQVAERAAAGLPAAWRKTVRDAAWRGADGLPEELEVVLAEAAAEAPLAAASGPGGSGAVRGSGRHPLRPRITRPPWWTAAALVQGLFLSLQIVGMLLLAGAVAGVHRGGLWLPALLVLGSTLGAPAVAAGCRAAARGPARAYGQEEERRLRRLSAGCGRTRVLEPVAAELLRYREVREQYVVAAGEGGPC